MRQLLQQETCTLKVLNKPSQTVFVGDDDAITRKVFLHYRSYARGIDQSPAYFFMNFCTNPARIGDMCLCHVHTSVILQL